MTKPYKGMEEYQRKYHARPNQKKNRAARGRARYALGLKVGDNREVDHKRLMSKGGGNGKSNLRVVSRKFNRSRPRK